MTYEMFQAFTDGLRPLGTWNFRPFESCLFRYSMPCLWFRVCLWYAWNGLVFEFRFQFFPLNVLKPPVSSCQH